MIGSSDGFTNLVFTNRELSICDWVFFRHFIWLLDKNKWLFWHCFVYSDSQEAAILVKKIEIHEIDIDCPHYLDICVSITQLTSI